MRLIVKRKSLLEAMQDLHENHNVSILMVTHDAFSASYCERILFIQDGLLYKELNRQGTRENFYQDILGVLAHMGSAAESK